MMDEKMRKAMEDSARRICHTMLRDMISRGTAEKYCHEMWTACLEYLGKAAGEFDEKAAQLKAMETVPYGISALNVDDIGNQWLKFAVRTARWQFGCDQSRIALAEQAQEEAELALGELAIKVGVPPDGYRCQIKDLESKLSAAEDEIEDLKMVCRRLAASKSLDTRDKIAEQCHKLFAGSILR